MDSLANLRRMRRDKATRDLAAETSLSVKDFLMPYFVIEGRGKREPIASMPGVSRLSIDNLIKDVEELRALGIDAILLFGVSRKKDSKGSEAYRTNGILQKAVGEVKRRIKEIAVITDVCMCAYTSHGHCGIVKSRQSSVDSLQKKSNHRPSTIDHRLINNDETLKILAKIALSHAEAGADLVAPSAMMDGQVGAIREALNENGFGSTGIFAYSAKYASNFYGPFRDALDSRPKFGDRKSYQMDYRNSDEAMKEIAADIDEGADIVMVKPALAYLDVIYRAKEKFNIPIAAYNVSGEYAMVKNYLRTTNDESFDKTQDSSRAKSRDERRTTEPGKELILEILTSIKRAGADLIITYHAKDAARWLKH